MSRRFLPRRTSDAGIGFPTGTVLAGFQQTSAPPGWTKNTTHNDKALRVVTGTPSTGGSSAFSTVFGLTATDGYTLLDPDDLPSHAHTGPSHTHAVSTFISSHTAPGESGFVFEGTGSGTDSVTTGAGGTGATSTVGSDGAHAHAIDLRVNYVDIIICTKS